MTAPVSAHGEGTTGGVAGPEPAPVARIAAVVAVLTVVVAVLGFPGGDLLTGAPYATLVAGPLEVDRGAGWVVVDDGATIGDGDRIRAAGHEVTLDPGGGRLVLAPGAQAVVDREVLVIERGSVLVDDDAPRSLRVDSVVAAGRGTWRIDRGEPSRVATYQGEVTAADASRQLTVPRYRQVTIRDRTVDAATLGPLRYLATDPFDRQVLPAAIRTDGLAAAVGRSLDSTYGTAPRPPSFYAAFAPDGLDGLDGSFGDLAPSREEDRLGPPAEVLVGLAVAEAVAAAADRAVDDAVREVADLRRRGAAWGLIVLAGGADPDGFNAATDRLLTRPTAATSADADAAADVAVADADAPSGVPPTADAGGAGDGPEPGPPGSDERAPPPPPAPGDQQPDPPSGDPPAPPPSAPPTVPPLGPLGEVVEDVGRGLGDVIEGTAELVEDVLGGVDELLQLPFAGGGLRR